MNKQTMLEYLGDGQARSLREIADACFGADIVAANHVVNSFESHGMIYKPSDALPFHWKVVPANIFSARVRLDPGSITASKIERGAISTQLSATAAHGEGHPHSCQTPASPAPGQSLPQSGCQSTDEGLQDQATPQSSPEAPAHTLSVRPRQSPSGGIVDLPDESLSVPSSASPRQHTTAADLLRAERAMNEGLRREVEISHRENEAATREWVKCAGLLKAEQEASTVLRAELQAARDVLALAVSRMDAADVANLLITLQEAKP